MALRYDRPRLPSGTAIYKPAGKDIPFETFDRREDAYWALANLIEDKLGPEGGTLLDIYDEVGRPLGLSSSDTTQLVKSTKKAGYLQ